MKKLKEFMNTPWTWGTYFKMCGASLALSGAMYAVMYAWLNHEKKKYLKELEEIEEFSKNNEDFKKSCEELSMDIAELLKGVEAKAE